MATAPDASASTLILGVGQGIGKPVYISTTEGSKHQWSCITSDSAIYFYDAKNNAIMSLRGQTEPISTLKGLYSYFINNITGSLITTDNPIDDINSSRAGVTASYNPKRFDVLFTFHDVQSGVKAPFTIAYNELAKCFTSFYDFYPTIYLNDKQNLFSVSPRTAVITNDQVWLHEYGNKGQYYGINYPSTVELFVNPAYPQTKVYDNIEIASEVLDTANSNINYLNETWSTIRCSTDHQNSDVITLVPNTNIKRRERTFNLQVPRNRVIKGLSSVDITAAANISPTQLFTDRLRDKALQINLVYNNGTNSVYRDFLCPYIKTIYRVSTR